MKNVVFEYLPYASWFEFGFFRFNSMLRDLGDFTIIFSRLQITVWTKKPYYKKKYLMELDKERE